MTLSRRDTILLAIVGLALLVGGTWWFVVKPSNANASATRDQIAEVETRINATRDTLDRLQRDSDSEAKRTGDRLRLAKAIPGSPAVPGALVQLERLAAQANVDFTALKTNTHLGYGALEGTQFEVRVTGRFFDVDDFMFRMHSLVRVDSKDEPKVKGRLFAATAVTIDLADEVEPDPSGSRLGPADRVEAVLTVVVFNEGDGSAASDPSAAATPAAAPAAAPAATAPTSAPVPAPVEAPADGSAGRESGSGGSEPQTEEGTTQ